MTYLRRGIAIVLALLLAIGMGGSLAIASPDSPPPSSAAAKPAVKAGDPVPNADDGMTLKKTLKSPGTLKPGETVTYEVEVGCSSNVTPCTNATLIDVLPPPLDE